MPELKTVTRRLFELFESALRDQAISPDYRVEIEAEMGRIPAVREDETGREL